MLTVNMYRGSVVVVYVSFENLLPSSVQLSSAIGGELTSRGLLVNASVLPQDVYAAGSLIRAGRGVEAIVNATTAETGTATIEISGTAMYGTQTITGIEQITVEIH